MIALIITLTLAYFVIGGTGVAALMDTRNNNVAKGLRWSILLAWPLPLIWFGWKSFIEMMTK